MRATNIPDSEFDDYEDEPPADEYHEWSNDEGEYDMGRPNKYGHSHNVKHENGKKQDSRGGCFYCGSQQHWVIDCPTRPWGAPHNYY